MGFLSYEIMGSPPPIVYINIWGAVRGVVWDEVGVFHLPHMRKQFQNIDRQGYTQVSLYDKMPTLVKGRHAFFVCGGVCILYGH